MVSGVPWEGTRGAVHADWASGSQSTSTNVPTPGEQETRALGSGSASVSGHVEVPCESELSQLFAQMVCGTFDPGAKMVSYFLKEKVTLSTAVISSFPLLKPSRLQEKTIFSTPADNDRLGVACPAVTRH